jgi:hypothetical protein
MTTFRERVAAVERRLMVPPLPVDLVALLHRDPRRIPRALRGAGTLDQIVRVFGDAAVHPDRGGVLGQAAIERWVRTTSDLTEAERLGRSQLHRTLYHEPWVRRVGDVAALNVSSAAAYLVEHHREATRAHLDALPPRAATRRR